MYLDYLSYASEKSGDADKSFFYEILVAITITVINTILFIVVEYAVK
jgi:hypothetical protein